MIFNHHSTIQSERQGPQLPNSQPMKWIWLSALLLLVTSAANFGIQLQQQSGNHVAYRSLAQGLCVEILASCGVSQDCSHMTTYQCSSLSSSGIQVDADGVVDMVFDAWVSEPFDECGEGSCPSCTAYKSCVGPMVQTDQQMLNAGDCILWEYKTEGGSDAFEVFVGVFGSSGNLVTNDWKRGESASSQLDWTFGQLEVNVSGSYYLSFFLASYDATGGGALGAAMGVRNIRSISPCLDDETLQNGPVPTTTSSSHTETITTSTASTATISSTTNTSSTGTRTTSTSGTTTSSTSTSSTLTFSATTSSTLSSTLTSSTATASTSTSSTLTFSATTSSTLSSTLTSSTTTSSTSTSSTLTFSATTLSTLSSTLTSKTTTASTSTSSTLTFSATTSSTLSSRLTSKTTTASTSTSSTLTFSATTSSTLSSTLTSGTTTASTSTSSTLTFSATTSSTLSSTLTSGTTTASTSTSSTLTSSTRLVDFAWGSEVAAHADQQSSDFTVPGSWFILSIVTNIVSWAGFLYWYCHSKRQRPPLNDRSPSPRFGEGISVEIQPTAEAEEAERHLGSPTFTGLLGTHTMSRTTLASSSDERYAKNEAWDARLKALLASTAPGKRSGKNDSSNADSKGIRAAGDADWGNRARSFVTVPVRPELPAEDLED